jgi:hypothetical protein
MITRTITSLFAALTLVSPVFGERPNIDETALRLGVEGWTSRRQQVSQDLQIVVNGRAATTTFRTGTAGRLTLRWEKRDGVWQIADDSTALNTAAR